MSIEDKIRKLPEASTEPEFHALVEGTNFKGVGKTPEKALRKLDDQINAALGYTQGGDKSLELARELGSKATVTQSTSETEPKKT